MNNTRNFLGNAHHVPGIPVRSAVFAVHLRDQVRSSEKLLFQDRGVPWLLRYFILSTILSAKPTLGTWGMYGTRSCACEIIATRGGRSNSGRD